MTEVKLDYQDQAYEHLIVQALYEPVPNMDVLRARKIGYTNLPIDVYHPNFNEPVVNIADYGIAGQAYYSRPNAVTGEPVPGAPISQFVRKSIAETLAKINASLSAAEITDFFGGEVELYIEDALRPVSLQERLFNDLIPALLRKNHFNMTAEEIITRRRDIIALPSNDPLKPSPHATGGPMDAILRFRQNTPMYVEGCNVPMGHVDGETGARISPDYFEQLTALSYEGTLASANQGAYNAIISGAAFTARRNRRAYYAIMTGSAFGVDTGLVNNPTEWWHWGRGDQLSAKVRGDAMAYYSLAEPLAA